MGAYRNAELDETFEQIIANPNLFRGSRVVLLAGLEFMTEVADLLVQVSRGSSVVRGLSHDGKKESWMAVGVKQKR